MIRTVGSIQVILGYSNKNDQYICWRFAIYMKNGIFYSTELEESLSALIYIILKHAVVNGLWPTELCELT